MDRSLTSIDYGFSAGTHEREMDGFESWLEFRQVQAAFVDVRGLRGQSKSSSNLSMTAFQHSPRRAPWERVFDGVVYVRDMEPCW